MQKPAISRDGPSGDEIAKRDLMIHAVTEVWLPYRSRTATRLLGRFARGVILLDDLRDFWWVS